MVFVSLAAGLDVGKALDRAVRRPLKTGEQHLSGRLRRVVVPGRGRPAPSMICGLVDPTR